MTEQQARAAGYTVPVIAESLEYTLELLVQPHAHLDDRFKGYDVNEGEMLRVNGWHFSIEREIAA